jgi:hypothetical protein
LISPPAMLARPHDSRTTSVVGNVSRRVR